MPLTVVITRDIEDCYHGFLDFTKSDLAPGVYAQPRRSAALRGRVCATVEEWHVRLRDGSIVMCWAEPGATGGPGLSTLGEMPKHVIAYDAGLLIRRALPR